MSEQQTIRILLGETVQDNLIQKEIPNRIHNLNIRLAEKYPRVKFENGEFYAAEDGHYFRLDSIPEYNSIVVEHGEKHDNSVWWLEDGDLFSMEELTEDQMLDAIIREV